MQSRPLNSLGTLHAAYSFLCEGYVVPQDRQQTRQVLSYLTEVLRGTSELPDDPADLTFMQIKRAQLRGYQAVLFKTEPDPVKPAYRQALVALEALRDRGL